MSRLRAKGRRVLVPAGPTSNPAIGRMSIGRRVEHPPFVPLDAAAANDLLPGNEVGATNDLNVLDLGL